MLPTDSSTGANSEDRRLWLIPLGLALLVLAAAAVVFGPRLRGTDETTLESIPGYPDPDAGAVTSGLEDLPQPGRPAPDFALPDLDGETVRLSDFAGRTVILNFWATWCAPCRVEMPALDEAAIDYGEETLVVLAINQEETADQVRDFFNEVGLTLPALLDGDAEVGRQYGAYFLPTTVVVGPDGIVIARHQGLLTRDDIDEYMAASDA